MRQPTHAAVTDQTGANFKLQQTQKNPRCSHLCRVTANTAGSQVIRVIQLQNTHTHTHEELWRKLTLSIIRPLVLAYKLDFKM